MIAEGPKSFATTEALLSAIVSSSEDAIYTKDRNAVIRSWNAAAQKLYGYTPEEAIGRDVELLIPPSSHGEEREILDRILQGERIDHYETRRLTKDGRIVDVSLTVSPVLHGNEILGASVIARDIRDRKEAEHLSRRLEKLEFVNLVAHELRNPLSALTGATDLLLSYAEKLDPDLRSILELIVRQARNAETLINDLLDFSRIQSGRFVVEMEPIDLASVAASALEGAPPPAGKDVNLKIPPDIAVMADRTRMRQVFANLLANAYNYGGSQITIQAHSEVRRVTLVFGDDGPGLPPGFETKAFELFVRVPGTRAAGTGLGLAITKGLIQAQGGSISYEPGEPGARFVLYLRPAPADGA
ncbi:MAG TPA: PAS domain-containing sensor histidine kinase [Actinomycetota bacterium]|nr:PAS domain-containing sensor histidine kinase [Actinomycetota bacterium]